VAVTQATAIYFFMLIFVRDVRAGFVSRSNRRGSTG